MPRNKTETKNLRVRQSLSKYFTAEGALQALEKYAQFAKGTAWNIERKLDLYESAAVAFDPHRNESERRDHFNNIYSELRSYWQVFRNAKDHWSADQLFNVLSNSCTPCGRGSMSLSHNLADSDRQKLHNCLDQVKGLKTLRSGSVAPMPLSKFLHFFNPMLFPIYDTAVVGNKVFYVFWDDWTAFCGANDFNARDTGTAFYSSYLLWAGELIRNGDPDVMEFFSEWFVKQVRPCRLTDIAYHQLKQHYATAFEFIAIGAMSLEKSPSS